MRKDLTEKLFNRFDFYKPEKPTSESLMSFGFECSDGWFNLLWSLSEWIEQILDRDTEGLKDNFYVVQVKEKFGGLLSKR